MPRVIVGASEIGIYSTGARTSPQPNVQYIFDVNGLRDPMSNRGFKKRFTDGTPEEVQKFVGEDPRVDAITEQVVLLAELSKSSSQDWISFAFRDHHGSWIAPAVAELVSESLSNLGYKVSTHHFALNDPRV